MCKQIVKDQIYECNGMCGASGTVWGSGLYTGDSNIYVAAKHAGLVPGRFVKTSMGPQNSFLGTTQNEVSTTPYGQFGSSYVLAPFSVDTKSQIHELFEDFQKELILMTSNLQTQFNQQNQDEYQIMNCTECLQNPRQYLVFPCCHVHFCSVCIKSILKASKCSVCQQGVTGHMKVFL